MKKEIEVNGRKFVIRELLAVEMDDIDFGNRPEAIKKQVICSTGITEDDYKNLTVKERTAILNVINELNNPDFQLPTK